MSVKPLVMNGMIQSTQDISAMKQNEDNKPIVQQQNIQIHQRQQEEHLQQQVQKSQESEREEYRYDAREKGNNNYEGNSRKKKQHKKETEEDGKVIFKGQGSSFDVKV